MSGTEDVNSLPKSPNAYEEIHDITELKGVKCSCAK